MSRADTTSIPDDSTPSVADLASEAEALGLLLDTDVDPLDARRQLLDRMAEIDAHDRGALLDMAEWAAVEVNDAPGNCEIVRRVFATEPDQFDTLSTRGLRALARLRGVEDAGGAERRVLVRRLRKAESFWDGVRRHRRRIMGSILSRALHPTSEGKAIPADTRDSSERLKREIQERGVVGGLATKLRGAADDYVAEKLDEIEQRIDDKLEEIDARLSEWRDREISNRLKILKITLIVSILVALISLGYDYLRSAQPASLPPAAPPSAVE
jgi:hypothetical protein